MSPWVWTFFQCFNMVYAIFLVFVKIKVTELIPVIEKEISIPIQSIFHQVAMYQMNIFYHVYLLQKMVVSTEKIIFELKIYQTLS